MVGTDFSAAKTFFKLLYRLFSACESQIRVALLREKRVKLSANGSINFQPVEKLFRLSLREYNEILLCRALFLHSEASSLYGDAFPAEIMEQKRFFTYSSN